MPLESHDGGPGSSGPAVCARSERPALARLVGDVAEFADDIWARGPLLGSGVDPDGFGDLLTEGAVDELLSERGLRTPFVRVAKTGSTLASHTFTAPGGVGAGIADQISDDKLTALFADGHTIVLQALHRVHPPIIAFCQQLSADLGHPVQANAYVTPPQNQGFDVHYDVHDVFVLQVAGRKKWTIHAPALPSPLRNQPWTDRRDDVRRAAEREPVIETVLEPGDALYLPRGYLHSASALGGVTVHLTLGVHSWTRFAVAEELVTLALHRLADDEEARRSLPLGTALDIDDLDADFVQKKLREVLESLDPSEVAEILRSRRRASQRAAPLGPLAQHALAAALTEDSHLRLREHLDPSFVDGTLTSRAGDVAVHEVPARVIQRLLDGHAVAAVDLGIDAARDLVRAGLVVDG